MLIFVVFVQILLNVLIVQSLNTDYVGYGSRDDTVRNYGNYPEISGYSKSFRRSRTSKDFNFTPNHNINNHDHEEKKTEDDASNYLRNFKPFLDDSDTDKLTEQQKLLLKNIADHLAQHEPEIIQEHQRKSLNLNQENANEGRARTKKTNSSKRKAKRPLTSIVVVQDSTTPSTSTKLTTTKTSTATSQSPSTKTTANQSGGSSSTLNATTKSATKSTITRQNAKVVAKNSITTTNKPNTSRLPSDRKRNVTSEDVGRGDSLSKLKPDQQPAESKVRNNKRWIIFFLNISFKKLRIYTNVFLKKKQ